MARRIRLTRLELKRQRDALARYERFLPTLKLKQQQLQLFMRQWLAARRKALAELEAAEGGFRPLAALLADPPGFDLEGACRPAELLTAELNVAGVSLPVLEAVRFEEARYSLFATPPWVDRVLGASRELARLRAALDILERQRLLVERELTRVTQRVNLFEKVMIPETREAIRRIRIALGDEMTAAVVRAKIAKAKLTAAERAPLAGEGGQA